MPSGMPRSENALRRINDAVEKEEEDAEVVRIVSRFLNHDDPEVREAVGLALMNVPHESAARHIERGLNDSNLAVKEAFVRAAMENNFHSLANKLGGLMSSTHPANENLRFSIATALGKLGRNERQLKALAVKEGDSDEVLEEVKRSQALVRARIKELSRKSNAERVKNGAAKGKPTRTVRRRPSINH